MKSLWVVAVLSVLGLVGCTSPCDELRDACDQCEEFALSCEATAATEIQDSCQAMLDTLEIEGCL